MISNQSTSRVDTLEMRAQIYQRVGHQRAEKYFDHLQRLFSSKITKCEFDRFCVRIIGRANIPLHNRLIRSIIKNACTARSPPPKNIKKLGSGYQRNVVHSPYADAIPLSPRKVRSPVSRDRKVRDRPSPLGPLGKPQSLTNETGSKAQSAVELFSLGSRPPVEGGSVEDGEEVEQAAGSPGVHSKSPVTAPLGVSLNSRWSRKSISNSYLFSGGYGPETCLNSRELPDTGTLRNHLERKLESEGIRVSMDCVNLLNNGLDVYLKKLVDPCVGLARSRMGTERLNQVNPRLMPGLNWGYVQRTRGSFTASLTDFHAAMELNPRILGEDWPIKLEKISLHTSEE